MECCFWSRITIYIFHLMTYVFVHLNVCINIHINVHKMDMYIFLKVYINVGKNVHLDFLINVHINIYKNVHLVHINVFMYDWNSLGRTSLLGKCHQNVRTLELLIHWFLIEITLFFFCVWSEIGMGKIIFKNISKMMFQKNPNFQLKIGYNSGCNMKYTWLLKVEYLLNGCTDLYEIWNLSSWDRYWLLN